MRQQVLGDSDTDDETLLYLGSGASGPLSPLSMLGKDPTSAFIDLSTVQLVPPGQARVLYPTSVFIDLSGLHFTNADFPKSRNLPTPLAEDGVHLVWGEDSLDCGG